MKKAKAFLLDLLFPAFCLGCKKEGVYLCEDCKAVLEILEYDYCLCDKNPLRIPGGQKIGKCQRCSGKKLAGLFSALSYKEKLLTRHLIHQFKYEPYVKDLAKVLANLIIEHLIIAKKNTDEIWRDSVLVPVPLYKKKIKIRGYNQAEELAKELSKILQVPVIPDVLAKIKNTAPQMELKKDEREKNLLGSFIVKNPSAIAQSKVFLVDDVYTTGLTMEECAKTLREAGAKQVWGIIIAREG